MPARMLESHKQRVKRVGIELVRGLKVLKGMGVYLPGRAIRQLEDKIKLGTLPVFEMRFAKNLGTTERGITAGQYVTTSDGAEYIELPSLNTISDITIMHEMVHQVRNKVPELGPLHKAEAYDPHAEAMDELATNWLAVHAAMINGYDMDEVAKFKRVQVYNPDKIEHQMQRYMDQRSGIKKRSFDHAAAVVNKFKKDREIKAGEIRKAVGDAKRGYQRLEKAMHGFRKVNAFMPFLRGVLNRIEGDYPRKDSPFYPRDGHRVLSGFARKRLKIPTHLGRVDAEMSTAHKLEFIVKVNNHLFKNKDVRAVGVGRMVHTLRDFRGVRPERLLKGKRGLSRIGGALRTKMFHGRKAARGKVWERVMTRFPTVGRFIKERKERRPWDRLERKITMAKKATTWGKPHERPI